MQGKIGIIVVSYHNPEMTTRYVRQELPKLTTPYTLVVVNVASNLDESKQLADSCGLCLVEDNHPFDKSHRGYLIWDKENLGYARGNNKGVRFLNTIGMFTHYLFSNDDVEIKDANILDVLVDSMKEHPDVACIGPRIIGIDGRDHSPHDRYISPYRLIGWRLFPFLRKKAKTSSSDENSKPSAHYTYWVSGAFMLVNAIRFNRVDGFDERTFLYMEEVILAERLKKIGWSMYYNPSVEVLHYEGSTTKTTPVLNNKRIHNESCLLFYKDYRKENCIILLLYKIIC